MKVVGHLKKYPAKRFLVDPRNPIVEGTHERVKIDFGNQCTEYEEEIDAECPMPFMDEIESSIMVDSGHGYDLVTRKSVTGLLGFIRFTLVGWLSKRQSSAQTATFGLEFIALKRGIEEAITYWYYLRSFRVKVIKLTAVHEDNLSMLNNSTNPSSSL